MINQIRIDRILQVSSPIVRQEDIYSLGPWIRAAGRELGAGLGDDAVVN